MSARRKLSGPHNKHGAIIGHAMFGGVYGDFQKDLCLASRQWKFDFYNNQIAPAAIIWWTFRPEPVAAMGIPRHSRCDHQTLQHQLRTLYYVY